MITGHGRQWKLAGVEFTSISTKEGRVRSQLSLYVLSEGLSGQYLVTINNEPEPHRNKFRGRDGHNLAGVVPTPGLR